MTLGVNQVINPTVRSVTFSIREAVAVTRTHEGRIHKLIDEGAFKPVVWGKRGIGRGHRLSPQQMYAIACVGALLRSPRGCGHAYAKEVFAEFEKMSEGVLEEWRGGVKVGAAVNDYTEEEAVEWKNEVSLGPVFGDHGQPLTTSDRRTVEDMQERMARVDEAIAIRKQGPKPKSDRVSDILGGRVEL